MHQIKIHPGTHIRTALIQAVNKSELLEGAVVFNFNGREFKVDQYTDFNSTELKEFVMDSYRKPPSGIIDLTVFK